jgi:hypothetical protein
MNRPSLTDKEPRDRIPKVCFWEKYMYDEKKVKAAGKSEGIVGAILGSGAVFHFGLWGLIIGAIGGYLIGDYWGVKAEEQRQARRRD